LSFLRRLSNFALSSVRTQSCAAAEDICNGIEILSGESSVPTVLPDGVRETAASFFSAIPSIYLPRTFRASISGGGILGEGVVLSRTGRILREVSVAHGYPFAEHPLANHKIRVQRHKASGRIAVLASRGADCYYHWLFDVLPRAGLLGSERIDGFIIQQNTTFQRQALSVLEEIVGCSRSLPCGPSTYFSCDELIVPSLPGVSGMPTPTSCAFLREQFGKKEAFPGRKLYISREDASKRRVVNEREVLSLVEPMGFEKAVLSGLTFQEQVKLFSEAAVIIAPHGASLANIVFAPSTATVIELFHPRYVHWCYWLICCCVGQTYHAILPEGSPAAEHVPTFSNAPVEANLSAIETLLAGLLH